MKQTPIIFSTDMVKAILDGRKTMTRRVIKDPRKRKQGFMSIARYGEGRPSVGDLQRELELTKDTPPNFPCPYGQAGDQLWVREGWSVSDETLDQYYIYKADGQPHPDIVDAAGHRSRGRWRPSIHMSRRASRITLEITDIRVERVQEISPHELATTDLEREGIPYKNRFGIDFTTKLERYVLLEDFKKLWDSLNAKRGYGWEVNPWVWVISFATGVRLK